MRARLCGAAVLVLVAAGAGVSARAEPAPLIVYAAPPDAPAGVAPAREALAALARDSGAAFLDVSAPPPSPPAAPELLARAIEAYDGLHLEDALARLDEAIAEANRTGAAGLSPSEISDLHLYRALVALARGDANRAWDDLVRSATVDPTRVLDPLRFPPKAVAAFGRAAREVKAIARGTLAVVADPGCRAFVDGRETSGPAPELPHGEHYVRVDCRGAGSTGASVILAETRKQVKLTPTAAALPDDDAVIALGRERAARSVLWVAVRASGSAPPTAWLRLREVASGRELGQASVALDAAGSAAADVRTAGRRLIDRAVGPVPDLVPREPPTPWYQKPWVWGVAGVAITAVILVPIAIGGGGSPSGARVQPTGDLWR